jgi:RND family efflux transporter MFP subunit
VDAAFSLWRKSIEAKQARRIEGDLQIAQAKAGLKSAMSKMHQAQMSVDLTSSSAQSDSQRADAAVKQAEAGVQQAEAGAKQADAAARRLKFLYEHGGVARTDMESAQTQAEIAHGSLDAARAALEQSLASARPARNDVPLRVNISKADLDAANAGVQQAKDSLRAAAEGKSRTLSMADRDIQSAQAGLEQAKAALSQAQDQAKSSAIESPLDGVINGITAQPGDMAQPGAPIMMVTSTGGIYLEAPAPTRYAPALKAGLSADITVDSMPDKTYDGHLLEVMPVAASDNRSLTLRFAFDVQPPHLMPNLTARAMIDLSRTGNSLSVQVEALRNDGGNPYVYIVQNGRAVRRNVTLGAIEGDFAEITDGLAQDDVVILSAPSTLQPGALVAPEGR